MVALNARKYVLEAATSGVPISLVVPQSWRSGPVININVQTEVITRDEGEAVSGKAVGRAKRQKRYPLDI